MTRPAKKTSPDLYTGHENDTDNELIKAAIASGNSIAIELAQRLDDYADTEEGNAATLEQLDDNLVDGSYARTFEMMAACNDYEIYTREALEQLVKCKE